MSQRKKYLLAGVLAALLVFWLFVAACVPYAHDDWDWGLPIGLEQWLTCSLNNRLAGNFFVVAMTRSPVFKTAVMGLCMFLIPLLLALLAARGDRTRLLPLLLAANALVLFMPLKLWQQSYGWVAGFANYGVSMPLFLGWLLLLRRALRPGQGGCGRLGALLLPYTVLLSLFLENLTALALLLSLALAVYALAARRGRLALALTLAGAALGCLLMFCNPLYGTLVDTGAALGTIRHLSFPAGSGLGEMLAAIFARYFVVLLPKIPFLGPAFSFLFAAIPALYFWRGGRRPLAALSAVPIACWVVYLIYPEGPPEAVGCVFAVLCWALLLLSAALGPGPTPLRVERSALVLLAMGSLAPLAAVEEMGGRLYLLPYLLLVLLFLDAAVPLLERRAVIFLCAAVLVCQVAWRSHAYYDIARCSALRQELITSALAQGADRVVVPTERYTLWWGRNPTGPRRAGFYKQFYGLPEDLTIVFLPPGSLDRWPEIDPADLDAAPAY